MVSVYIIVNTVTYRGYVGITSGTVQARYRKHWSDVNRGSGGHLHRAMRKYGPDVFVVEVLATAETWDDAAQMEIRLIQEHKTRSPLGYNMTDGGEGTLGYRHTKEWKAEAGRLNSQRQLSEAALAALRVRWLGRTHSAESKKKMSISRTGLVHKADTIEKMKASAKRRWRLNPRVCSPLEAERLRGLSKGRKNTPKHNEAIRAALTGIKRSAESLAKMRVAAARREQKKRDVKTGAERRLVVPAGDYYLGDPGYAEPVAAAIVLRTAMGDGIFESPLGPVMVDSACIGLVPVGAVRKAPRHMYRVTFPEATTAEKRGSKLVFGPFTIDTDPHGLREQAQRLLREA